MKIQYLSARHEQQNLKQRKSKTCLYSPTKTSLILSLMCYLIFNFFNFHHTYAMSTRSPKVSPILESSPQDNELHPEAPVFHPEVIAEAFPSPERSQKSHLQNLSEPLDPKILLPSGGYAHRIEITPLPSKIPPNSMQPQNYPQHHPIHPSPEESTQPLTSSLKAFPQPYLQIIQLHYQESSYLMEKYNTSDHYLFSLYSQSHPHLSARQIRRLNKNHEVQLELIAALWAVENHLITGPIERAFEGGWLIDHHGILWDVITPMRGNSSLSQESTPDSLTSMDVRPILKRVKTFLALNHPTLQKNITARVLINSGLLSTELKRELTLALQIQLDPKEVQWISFIDFNPHLIPAPSSSDHSL